MTDASTPLATPRKALVTGSTSGIGRATALALAADGFEVIVHGRDAARGEETVAAIHAAGGRARPVLADLSSEADRTRLASEAADVEVLVNNGGTSWSGPSAEMSAEAYDRLFDGNVRATYLLTSAIAPRMAERGRGSIVNLGSVLGAIGASGTAAYAGSKVALEAMTRAWAAEYGARGVRVNTVSPGPIRTPIWPDGVADVIGKSTILGRAGEDHEIASVIAFLASDRASYVTGATIPVDGGRSAL